MSAPGTDAAAGPVLAFRDVEMVYRVRGIDREVVRGVSFEIGRGESYGLVGESGCGKSTIALGIVRYLPRNGRITRGTIEVNGRDVNRLGESELRRYRASTVSMVYQSPGSALNPSLRVGDQLAEVFTIAGASRREARTRALEALRQVQIADPESVLRRYPHQLSGGMLQRVVIAMALATDPALLILDEPTTGLDATVEAEVLDLVSHLRERLGTSVLFISHNLGIIANMCDRVGVLYAGRLVEEGPALEVFRDPRHPYAVGLLRCLPRAGVRKDESRLDTIPGSLPPIGAHLPGCVFADRCGLVQPVCREQEPDLLPVDPTHHSRCHFWPEAHTVPRTTPAAGVAAPGGVTNGSALIHAADVSKTFKQDGLEIRALTDVALDLRPGETLGLVGESGSGKTTFARVLLGLTKPDGGSEIELEGQPLSGGLHDRTREQVRSIQIVFQNPDAALNRRAGVRGIIGRAANRLLGLRGGALDKRVTEVAEGVRLSERHLNAKPYQLSGGLKQRVAIARAFAGAPAVVVCDEPTSALDVSVQAAILNLLADLQVDQQTSYLFISHDLGVVRYLSDRIAVLYVGHVLELGDAERVFGGPHHPYTEALLSAVPNIEGIERKRIRLAGEIPSAAHLPSGCVFHSRCPRKKSALCETEQPPLVEKEPGHWMRCHWTLEELAELQKTAPEGQPEVPPI